MRGACDDRFAGGPTTEDPYDAGQPAARPRGAGTATAALGLGILAPLSCWATVGDDRAKVEQCRRDFQRDLES